MTKSRHSATKLRLSRLVRILAALCCLKVAALGLAFFDVPLPHWLGGDNSSREAAQHAPASRDGAPDAEETTRRLEAALLAQKGAGTAAPAAPEAPAVAPLPEGLSGATPAQVPALAGMDDAQPQGSAAAELAAAARPRPRAGAGVNGLPAPVIAGGLTGAGFTAPNVAETALNGPELPTPPPLGSPLVPAGIPAPRADVAQAEDPDGGSLWNLLGLTSLPIPGLGSAREAHAAALDMPVPATPPSPPGASSFAPAEQLAPMGVNGAGAPAALGGPTALPGAAPIPATIPRGQGADGAPLPPRAGELPSRGLGGAAMPALPQTDPSATWPAPAPQVTPKAPPADPNAHAQDLARQQQDILMLRQQMDQRLKDLQSAEGKMKDMIREAKELEDKKVKNLILMYGNMKPRMAAQALENMDERVAVRILSGMAPKQSGEILTYTNPAKTAKFTEMITRMRMPE